MCTLHATSSWNSHFNPTTDTQLLRQNIKETGEPRFLSVINFLQKKCQAEHPWHEMDPKTRICVTTDFQRADLNMASQDIATAPVL